MSLSPAAQFIMIIGGFIPCIGARADTGPIARYDAETGAYIDNFAAGISGPSRMKIGPDNLLYVLQWSGNGKVRRDQLDGSMNLEFVDCTQGLVTYTITSLGISSEIPIQRVAPEIVSLCEALIAQP